jgi:ketosteroid isomerase-like protein
MSAENVELVRAFYPGGELRISELIEDGRLTARGEAYVATKVTDNFEWVGPRDAVGVPSPREGVDALVENYGELWRVIDDAVITPHEFFDHGDRVLVVATISGRFAGSDVPFSARGAAVYTLEDGKFSRIEEFTDMDAARAAAEGSNG